MQDMSGFDDVLSKDIQVEETQSSEFEFDNGAWYLKRERNHWEIFIEEAEDGEVGIIVEREYFVDGKFGFEIDGTEHELLLEDFDRIDKFYHEECIQ